MSPAALLIGLLACAEDKISVEPNIFPDPSAWTRRGPGGPSRSFTEDELGLACASLTGGASDAEHHNLVGIYDGYLLMPWAPESGGGGITVFDFADPCAPIKVGEAEHSLMRESHTLAVAEVAGRTVLAVDTLRDAEHGGIGFWDLSEPSAPVWLSELDLPGFHYQDAYFRVSLSTFWQGDLLFVSAGFLGVFVVDVADPSAPELVYQWTEPAFLAGTFHVIGNLALASSAGLSRTMVWDIGDLDNWQLLTDFEVQEDAGELRPYYFANIGGRYALFARKDEGGGPMVYDLTVPDAPPRVGAGASPDGDGGYVFRHEDQLFQGESNFGARYAFDDPALPVEVARFEMPGDFDTLTPIGNVAVASVDKGGDPGEATLVFPWATAPDARGPRVDLVNPPDGAVWVPQGGRIGLSFDEQIEPMSVHSGSLRVWSADGNAVRGRFYTQENLVNFVPDTDLPADTTLRVEVPAGGIADVSGNPTTESLTFYFATGPTLGAPKW